MLRTALLTLATLTIAGGAAGSAAWAAAAPTPYGNIITLEQAKKAAAGAEAEARKRGVAISIAVAGITGEIVFFEHMDGAVYATDDLSKLKAKDSARFRMPTSQFNVLQKAGQEFPGVFVGGGGMPLIVDGKVVGAIGISGAADDPIAQAGVDALK